MAVKIRLTRMGAKKRPMYRIVASDSRRPRDGEYLELIGTYNPVATPADVKIDEEKALKWLSTGAIPSDTVRSLFSKAGIMTKIVKSIVTDPEAVSVKEFETEEEKRILIQVMTSSEDLGRVIGKQGRTANAIRTLVQASSALKENKYVQIDFDKF